MTVSIESEVASPEESDTAAAGMVAESPAPEEFDLDIRFVESGPVVEELLRPTDDGCGQTCESACSRTCP